MVAYIFCNSSAHLEHLKDNKCLNQPYVYIYTCIYIYLSESSQMLRSFNLYQHHPFSNLLPPLPTTEIVCHLKIFPVFNLWISFFSNLSAPSSTTKIWCLNHSLAYIYIYIYMYSSLRILPNIALVSVSLSFVDIITSCHHSSMDHNQ